MNTGILKSYLAKLTATAICAVGLHASGAAAAEPVKIATTNWADVLAVANVVKYVLETKLQQPVQFVQADIGIQYQGVARGDLDLMVGGWLPVTHGTYYARYKNDMDDVSAHLYRRQEWVGGSELCPESELSWIADLNKPDVKSKLNSTIQGIEPGGGLMQASEKAIKEYDLAGYKLQSSSEAGCSRPSHGLPIQAMDCRYGLESALALSEMVDAVLEGSEGRTRWRRTDSRVRLEAVCLQIPASQCVHEAFQADAGRR